MSKLILEVGDKVCSSKFGAGEVIGLVKSFWKERELTLVKFYEFSSGLHGIDNLCWYYEIDGTCDDGGNITLVQRKVKK